MSRVKGDEQVEKKVSISLSAAKSGQDENWPEGAVIAASSELTYVLQRHRGTTANLVDYSSHSGGRILCNIPPLYPALLCLSYL